jgi:glycosyltransferase involved in cell wall biosynthesis
MHVAFLVPDIHNRPTGGNIYNRRIIAELQKRGAVEVTSWSPKVQPRSPIDPPDGAAIVVDSLLARHDDALRSLRAAHPTATLVLLAHYLHCIDPNEQEAPEAATERAVLPLFDGVVTPSRYARRALIGEGGSEERIAVVPPGLDDAYRAPVPDWPIQDPPRLLTVANLLPGKGLRSLVDVLGALADEAWTWTLVGDDTLDPTFADTLHEQIQAAPVANRITKTGAVPTEALRAQYDQADVFVLPSRFETCSMATREAMARGLPVAGYEVGGLPDNVGEADAARLVSPGSPQALADALRALLSTPAMRVRMGQAARERSAAFPTWEEAGRRFHTALRSAAR